MNPKSAIEKGKRLEKYIANEIEQEGLGAARREQGSGSGKKKGDIFCNLPFLIEAKHWDKIRILEWIDQAKSQAEIGNWSREKWAVVFNDFRKGEFQNLYAVIDFWEWLGLLKKNAEPKVKEPDRQLTWDLKSLLNVAKKVVKQLEP